MIVCPSTCICVVSVYEFFIQIATNGLVFTIFGVFEAHTSIRHLPNDAYSTEGFVVKKKVRHYYIDSSSFSIIYAFKLIAFVSTKFVFTINFKTEMFFKLVFVFIL